jgi:hypothetical protein
MLKSLTAGEIYIHPSIKSAVIYQIANWQPLRRNNVDGTLDLLCYMQPVVEQYGHLMLTDEQEQMLVSEENKVQEHNSPF